MNNTDNTRNLLARITALAARANAARKQMEDFNAPYDFEKVRKDENEMYAELDAINKAAGYGLVVGRVLSFGVADGSASYIVTKVRKNDVVVEWIPLGDAYFSDAVGLSRDKTQYVVNRHTAESHCQWDEKLKEIFSRPSPVTA